MTLSNWLLELRGLMAEGQTWWKGDPIAGAHAVLVLFTVFLSFFCYLLFCFMFMYVFM